MMTGMSKWAVPAVGFVVGLLVAAAELGRRATPLQAALAFAIVAAYALGLRLLQSRSETASLLSGLPVDERRPKIHRRRLCRPSRLVTETLDRQGEARTGDGHQARRAARLQVRQAG